MLVIDEVQNLSLPLLEEIRILSDLEVGRKLLQVVLVGQPEFEDQLRLPRMRQIEQRVTVHSTLRPLDRDEVCAYVPHRLRLAGGGSESVRLTQEALDTVYQATGGVPRVINLLCDKALSIGQKVRTSRIGAGVIQDAMADLRMRPVEPVAVLRTATSACAPDSAKVPPDIAPAPLVAPPDGATDDERSRGLFEARAGAGVPPHRDDLLALLALPAVDLDVGDQARHDVSSIRSPPGRQARGKVRRGGSRLSPLAAAALVALGTTTGVSVFGYWVWLRPALTAPLSLPAVTPPPAPVPPLGPLGIATPDQPTSSAPVEAQDAAAPATPAGGGSWAVQTGAFAERAPAAVLVARLEQLGYTAFWRDLDFPRGRFRVTLVGPFARREQAEAARGTLRRVPGLEDSLVTQVEE